MADRVTQTQCRRKAAILSQAHGVDLQINVEYGRPSVLARAPGSKRWRTVVTRRSTGQVFDALCMMEEAWELVNKNAPAIRPAYAVVEVEGGIATVTQISKHAVVTIIDHDDPTAIGGPEEQTIGLSDSAVNDADRVRPYLTTLDGTEEYKP